MKRLQYKMTRALERMAIFVFFFFVCILDVFYVFKADISAQVDTWRCRDWTGLPICLLIVAISWPLADLIFLPSHI